MRIPIKLNIRTWPKLCSVLLPSVDDPRQLVEPNPSSNSFTRGVSALRFGATFKTTKKNRFPKIVNAIKSLKLKKSPIVLDIGASDGSSSLHTIESIDFKTYYITDLNAEVYVSNGLFNTYFFNTQNECIIIANKFFIIYPKTKNTYFPFNHINKFIFKRICHTRYSLRKIELINPEVKLLDRNIKFKIFNISDKWVYENGDLIIVANLLNRGYFNDDFISSSLRNLISILNNDGYLVIVDSREIEKGTIFSYKEGVLNPEININGGTEILDLVMKLN